MDALVPSSFPLHPTGVPCSTPSQESTKSPPGCYVILSSKSSLGNHRDPPSGIQQNLSSKSSLRLYSDAPGLQLILSGINFLLGRPMYSPPELKLLSLSYSELALSLELEIPLSSLNSNSYSLWIGMQLSLLRNQISSLSLQNYYSPPKIRIPLNLQNPNFNLSTRIEMLSYRGTHS